MKIFCNMDSNQDLQIAIDRIIELTDNDEEDEFGRIVIPSELAIAEAISLLTAAAQLCNKFVKPWVSIEDNQGIYLTWSNPKADRALRLLFSGDSKSNSYIYYEEKEEYDTQININAKDLSKWIDWIYASTK